MNEVTPLKKQRRVRPWIAAMLTFIGWGLGAYYAGKAKLAVGLAISQILFGFIFGLGVFLLIFHNALPPAFLPAPDSITYFDGVVLLVGIPIAIFVFIKVSGVKHATNRGIPGLLGYAALWTAPIIASVAIALTVRTYIVQPFHIPSGAMQPTIAVNDYVLVDKMRFRDKSIAPARGELVVFKNQRDGNLNYIFRIIGMPGDVIMIQDGEISINGEKISREFESTNLDGSKTFRETLDNGTSYLTIDHGAGPLDNVGPYEIPSGHYFFMGDNRDRAQDSRVISRVGYIPREHLLGPVTKITRSKE